MFLDTEQTNIESFIFSWADIEGHKKLFTFPLVQDFN